MGKPVSDYKISILKKMVKGKKLIISDIGGTAWISPRGGRVTYHVARTLVGSPLVRAVKLRDGGRIIEYAITNKGREAIPKKDEDEKKT